MLIIEFEKKPAKERKELMKQLEEKNKIVMYTFLDLFENINSQSIPIKYILYAPIGKRKKS